MAQTSFALLTNVGRQKEAAALGNGTALVVTHIAIGDGATVPSGGETQLYHEVLRKTISGQGVVAGATNVAYADIFLAASEGPFTIREAGLFDSAGDLIAIAHYDPPVNKPAPSSGQTVEGIVRIEVAFSNTANVSIIVDPSLSVALQRLSRLPDIPVISAVIATPPASPVVGDVYVVPAGATGVWSGQASKVAEFTSGGWAFMVPKPGLQVQYWSGRQIVLRFDGAAWAEDLATEAAPGRAEIATIAEVAAGTDDTRYVTPSKLAAVLGSGNVDRAIVGRQSAPPGSPVTGAAYIVGASPTGAWAGQAEKLALWTGAAWSFIAPATGLQVNSFDGISYTAWFFTGAAWVPSGVITGAVTVNVPGTYATLAEAFATLSRFRIVDGASVTIQLAAQVYNVAAAIFMNHPDGHRITVQGTMSGAVPAIGDFAMTGSGSSARAADNAANLAMLRTRYGTRIVLGATNSAFVVDNASPSPTVKDLLVEGQGGAGQTGIAVEGGGAIKLNNVAVHGCEHGYFANLRSFISSIRGSVTGSAQNGIRALQGSTVSLDGTFSLSAAVNGIWAQHGSTVSAIGQTRTVQVKGNGANGISVQNAVGNAQSLAAQNNGAIDIIAYAMAAVDISGGSVTVNTTSPATNTVGNSNSYIAA